MKVRYRKLAENAVAPKYAKSGDAGLDLTAISEEWNEDNSIVTYGTGLAFEIPEGYVGLIFPRSSIYKTTLQLSNSVGVIDSGYRGEIKFKFRYLEEGNVYNGESRDSRVGQMIIMPYPTIELEESDELSDTERGEGGYGSTGI